MRSEPDDPSLRDADRSASNKSFSFAERNLWLSCNRSGFHDFSSIYNATKLAERKIESYLLNLKLKVYLLYIPVPNNRLFNLSARYNI